jgi:phthiocerol/phenolphthiocerol synthesis type-I polyketide synthase E
MMQELPEGAMLAVMLAESELKACLPSDLSIAAVNANTVCVVAGPHPAIDAFEPKLTARGAGWRRLRTSHAFHSAMVDPVIEPLAKVLAKIPLSPPGLPYVSTISQRGSRRIRRRTRAIGRGIAARRCATPRHSRASPHRYRQS